MDPIVIIAIAAAGALWLLLGLGPIIWGVKLMRERWRDYGGQGDALDVAFSIGGIAIGLIVLCLPVLMWKYPTPDRPCVRYETTMQYNAATKTTMPVRYCAQYGEWVEP